MDEAPAASEDTTDAAARFFVFLAFHGRLEGTRPTGVGGWQLKELIVALTGAEGAPIANGSDVSMHVDGDLLLTRVCH